jgi:threonine dehydratase
MTDWREEQLTLQRGGRGNNVVLVSDDEIAMALKLIMSRAKQVVEPAAAPLAALLTGKTGTAHGTNTVAVLSGGNIDLERLRGLL